MTTPAKLFSIFFMKKSLSTIFLSLIISAVFAQKHEYPENVFFLTTGLGYRVVPFDLNMKHQPGFIIMPVYYDRDEQINGLAFNIGLQYYLVKPKLGFEYGNSFRYDLLYLQNDGISSYEKRVWTTDFHFSIYKYFSLKKNQLKTGIGYSALNNGSVYVFGDDPSMLSYDNFHFSSFNVITGYQLNQLSFDLVSRFTTQHRYWSADQMYIPELRITYALPLKNKKVF